jgi:NAD+ synthase (glutamine-hydrolysing)
MPAPTLRLALAQLNTTVGDLRGNARLVLEAAREAAAQGAALVAAPELAITGYPPEDLLLRPAFVADVERALQRLARDADGLPPLVVGALEQGAAPRIGSPVGALYNTAALLHEGRVVARYRKQRLPNYGVFDEQRYFVPGEEAPLFAIGGAVVGLTVCEDIWYPDGPVGALCAAGAQLIVNINASPFWAGKTAERLGVAAERAREHGAAVAYVNQVGGQDELVFDGNSLVVDARGELLARGACFEEQLLLVDVPLPERPPAATPLAVSVAPATLPAPLPLGVAAAPPGELDEIYRALVVGTRDYVRKCGFAEVIVSLSGGIDSALVAAIAVDALGPAQVRGVALPSRYSSEGSLADARELATRLGIELATLPIEPVHAATLDVLARELTGGEPGSAEENLQARIRDAGDGALQQERRDGADHRQQVRVRLRLRDPLRRYGRWIRGDQGRAEDPSVPPRVAPQRGGRSRDPTELDREAALRRAATRPARLGRAAAVRRARRDPRGVRGAGPLARGDRRRRPRRCDRPRRDPPRRSQRVQAPAVAARREDHATRLWPRSPSADGVALRGELRPPE